MAEIVRTYDPDEKVEINWDRLDIFSGNLPASLSYKKVIRVHLERPTSLTRGEIVDFCARCDFLNKHGICSKSAGEQAERAVRDLCMTAEVDKQTGWMSKDNFFATPKLAISLIKKH